MISIIQTKEGSFWINKYAMPSAIFHVHILESSINKSAADQ